MLKQRIITALVAGAIFIFCLFFLPKIYVLSLFLIIIILAAWEWVTLTGPRDLIGKISYVLLVSGFILSGWQFGVVEHNRFILLLSGLWWALMLVLTSLYQSGWLHSQLLTRFLQFAGFIILIPAWVAVSSLYLQSPQLLLFFLALIWVADIAAFGGGRKFGKRKLAPELSPGKTREGLWAAILATLVMAGVGIWYFELTTNVWLYFICLCLLTSLISVVGDLFESLLKRNAGVKDSGKLLPGHGGVLDRIDSILGAAPGFALGLYWM